MITKELLEARWKIILGATFTLLSAALVPLLYSWVKPLLEPEDMAQLGEFAAYVGSQWFGQNSASILGFLAIILGASLIAGEVSKGTIFFLLSRPLSRRQIIAYKFASSALVLLVLLVAGSGIVVLLALTQGQSLNLRGVLLSTMLGWIGVLSLLALAMFFSVIFNEPLRAAIVTFITVALILFTPDVLSVPAWNPGTYWFRLETLLNGSFPAVELLVCSAAVLLPLALTIVIFEQQSY